VNKGVKNVLITGLCYLYFWSWSRICMYTRYHTRCKDQQGAEWTDSRHKWRQNGL